MRDINGASFALLFASQVMSGMARTLETMTAWAAATAVDQDEAGRQDWRFRMEFFQAGQEMAADERGMFRDFEL